MYKEKKFKNIQSFEDTYISLMENNINNLLDNTINLEINENSVSNLDKKKILNEKFLITKNNLIKLLNSIKDSDKMLNFYNTSFDM